MLHRLTTGSQIFQHPIKTTGTASWWRSAVFYEVYIRSFQDSNGDGIGDLRGIEQRLPYLKQLGIDAIWITPFYPSPMADFGYDVSDYTDVDPSFGTMADFDRLLQSAHDLNMRVVIDMVLNHTSDEHPWFAESRSSRTNPKRDWYIWREAKPDGSPPNNWTTFFGGSAWTWDEHTRQYYLHLFLDRQPDLNWRNPEVIQAMESVLRFWLDKGVDGFRLDAVNFLIKHEALPDMPIVTNAIGSDLVQYHIYANNQPELHPLLQNVRRILESYPGDRVLIGETGTLKAPELSQFYGAGLDEIHLPMIVLPLHTNWQAKAMRECLIGFYAGLPHGASPHFVFGNHDDKRLITRYGMEHHRSVAMLLLTLRGSPILYYGDEIAMCDTYIPPEKRVDTAGMIAPDQYPGRDPNRTPMQWDASTHAGFTSDSVEPWLPINENYTTINVAAQEHNPVSTLTFYRTLIQLRSDSRALREGSIRFIEDNGDVLAYLREYDAERLLIVINFGGDSHVLDLSTLADQAQCVLSSTMQRPEAVSVAEVALDAYESVLFRLTSNKEDWRYLMSNNARRMVLVLFLLVLVLSVAAVQAQDRVQVTILGTIKPEIDDPFMEAVEAYNASQDLYEVVVIPGDGDPVQMMTSLSASGNMPTIINMGQEFSLFKDTLCDVTDTTYSQHAFPGTQADVTIDGRVYGMPITIEAFGLLYNQAVLDEAVGGTFDPATINTRSALAELLAAVDALDSTDAAIHLSGLDWSLGAHFTNIMFTDQSADAAERVAFIEALKAGEAALADNEVYNGWLDTLDLLMQYNQNAPSPLAPTYDDGVLALGLGEVGFWFMGNWALPNLFEINPDVDYGILPVPVSDNAEDYGNTQISIGVPSNLVIDCAQSTPEEQAGAIDFLNWFVTDPVGQDYWVNRFNFLPVYDTFTIQPEDAMSQQILQYAADGQSLQWMNNLYPAGGWQTMGASMQKYVTGQIDRAGLAGELEAYWQTIE